MRTFAFLFLILILGTLTPVLGARPEPKFFVFCTASGDSASKYAGAYERVMAYYLNKAFPCARVKTRGDIANRLGLEKIKQLTGQSQDLPSFCDDLACDYFLNIELSDFLSDQVMASASCILYKKVDPMVRFAKNAPRTYAGIKDVINLVAKTLTDKLGKYEICPFTGPVNVVVSTRRDTTETEEYPVYCSGMDQQYKKVTKTSTYTESTWNLQRKGISWTDGTMNFYTGEEIKVEEDNGCYKCKSGREGGRIYKQSNSMKVNGSGISHESIHEGKQQLDTRVELEFRDDGTYIIRPRGTSLPAQAEERFEVSAQGTCDNLEPKTKTIKREVTVPLNTIFGPYPGKSTDKLLKQHDVKKVRDPVTGELSTITIDFELKHD